jgi:hypothetical protein
MHCTEQKTHSASIPQNSHCSNACLHAIGWVSSCGTPESGTPRLKFLDSSTPADKAGDSLLVENHAAHLFKNWVY